MSEKLSSKGPFFEASPEPVKDATPTFEEMRWQYFVKLGLKHKNLLVPHREGGQLSRDVVRDGKRERWGDPTEHCLVEAAAADILADLIDLSKQDRQNLVAAAFVHDAGKRYEIENLRGVSDPEVVERVYAETKNMLSSTVSDEVIALVESVAHTSLPQFAELDANNNIVLKDGLDTAALAMHYIDDITIRTEIGDFDERIDALEAKAASGLYPYNEEGRAIWGGRTFFEAQREVGKLVQARLAAMIGTGKNDPERLPELIDFLLREDIKASYIPPQEVAA